MSLGIVFLSEVFGTAMLTLLGCGVVANVALKGTKGYSGGFLMVTWGWGIAVFAGVFVAARSGAHLNPAVTLGILVEGKRPYAPEVPIDVASTLTYFGGEMLGALLGAVVCWAAYKGPTGYAINPARDLGPRIAHALLPIKGKGTSDWAYSWIPVVGPLAGGALGGIVARIAPIIITAAA
jgi:glycerol uptake facilitator-like aquaporin